MERGQEEPVDDGAAMPSQLTKQAASIVTSPMPLASASFVK